MECKDVDYKGGVGGVDAWVCGYDVMGLEGE